MKRCSISQRYFSCAGLEFRHGAEIDQFGIDRLAALQLLQQLDRAEADALVLDIDDRAVVGLEGVFGFELDQLVGPDDLEVGAERQDLAVDPSPVTSPPMIGMIRRTPCRYRRPMVTPPIAR